MQQFRRLKKKRNYPAFPQDKSNPGTFDEEGKAEDSENVELEYGTMPGSWASYEAERQKENEQKGNGVYPDGAYEPKSGAYFGALNSGYNRSSENNSGWQNGGWQNGGWQNGGWQNNSQWQNERARKTDRKKKFVLYGILAAIVLAVVIFSVVGAVRMFNDMLDELANTPPASGQQGGGEQSGGSGQSGGAPSSGNPSGSQSSGNNNLQNGDFSLEQASPDDKGYKLSDVYKATESTVVAIRSSIGSGSGVIISKDEKNEPGYYVVTNNHVIVGATDMKVTLSNGSVYDAELVGRDANTDLAVLKIVTTDTLKVATLGKSDELLVAEEVLIIGNPLGTLGGTATNGIVSAKGRKLTIDGFQMSLIQTNAAINGGNSGGGMFNTSGQLVGIVNAKYVSEEIEGIGFAIPIDTAAPIITALINNGYVEGRSNLGIELVEGSTQISKVWAGSDAEAAGLKAGDVIYALNVNGVAVTNDDISKHGSLSAYLNTLNIGDYVVIVVRQYSMGYPIGQKDYPVTITQYTGDK